MPGFNTDYILLIISDLISPYNIRRRCAPMSTRSTEPHASRLFSNKCRGQFREEKPDPIPLWQLFCINRLLLTACVVEVLICAVSFNVLFVAKTSSRKAGTFAESAERPFFCSLWTFTDMARCGGCIRRPRSGFKSAAVRDRQLYGVSLQTSVLR